MSNTRVMTSSEICKEGLEEFEKIWPQLDALIDEFVEEYKLTDPVVFDMELAYILALGFKKVESIKIVSDNLSLKEYEENI